MLTALLVLVVALVWLFPQRRMSARIENFTAGQKSVIEPLAGSCNTLVTHIRKWIGEFTCIISPIRLGLSPGEDQTKAFENFTNACVRIDSETAKYRPVTQADIALYLQQFNQFFGDRIDTHQGCGLSDEISCSNFSVNYFQWDEDLNKVIRYTLAHKYLLDMLIQTLYVLKDDEKQRLDLHTAFVTPTAQPRGST
jgi:hypothetical protein